jgi:hypothetical protein
VAVLWLAVFTASIHTQAQEITTDPDRVRLEVSDIRRLAQVLRTLEATNAVDTTAVLERDYLAAGSPGLRAYAREFNLTSTTIASALAASPKVYANLDRLADNVLAQDTALRSAFRRLQGLFPDAAFPPIWFVIGHNRQGGGVQREGVLIAAERFTDRPEDLVPIVLHELAHFQQAMVQGVDLYLDFTGPRGTLLARALREGSAEVIVALTAGRHINSAAERYGAPREAAVWARFQRDMRGAGTREWMFVQPRDSEQPPDLGYWVGYRIAKSYYDRAPDKRQALREIIGLTTFDAFLEASRYADAFAK